jgi:hypothetical protein
LLNQQEQPMGKMWIVVALVLTPVFASRAVADVIDFNQLQGSGIEFGRGFIYTEDGFVLENLGELQFASVHSGDFRFLGSVSFYNNTPGGVTRLTRSGGGVFGLDFIDLNSLNRDEPVTVTFTGRPNGSALALQSFTTDAVHGFQRFTFGPPFDAVTEVSWVQAEPFHYFDNIGVNTSPTPEPSTLWLLGTTLGCLLLKRARNVSAARINLTI